MIDVVIPVHNQFELVCQCVDSVMSQVGVRKVIVVDDSSTDCRLNDYYNIVDILLSRTKSNLGFLGTANIGMSLAETEFAVIINSDVIATKQDSLFTLVDAMIASGANVASGKLLYMPGSRHGKAFTIQHAGVGFGPDGVPYHPFMNLHQDVRAANIAKRVTAVSGAVFGVRMSTWNEIGGFDPVYGMGVYEDVDYCLKAGKVLYEPKSVWLHLMHGSQTPENDMFEWHSQNLRVLLGRWQVPSDEELYYGI